LHLFKNPVRVSFRDSVDHAESPQAFSVHLSRGRSQNQAWAYDAAKPEIKDRGVGADLWRVVTDQHHIERRTSRQIPGFGVIPGNGCVHPAVFKGALQHDHRICV
jgi:hypothetical protein